MSTKEQDFKQRFVAIIRDLQENGRTDAEAMWLVGSFASKLIDLSPHKSWGAFKRKMSAFDHDVLLNEFQEQGNRFHREGKVKAAYAIQLLAASVIARTQADTQILEGDKLLDQAVNNAVAMYRQVKARPATN